MDREQLERIAPTRPGKWPATDRAKGGISWKCNTILAVYSNGFSKDSSPSSCLCSSPRTGTRGFAVAQNLGVAFSRTKARITIRNGFFPVSQKHQSLARRAAESKQGWNVLDLWRTGIYAYHRQEGIPDDRWNPWNRSVVHNSTKIIYPLYPLYTAAASGCPSITVLGRPYHPSILRRGVDFPRNLSSEQADRIELRTYDKHKPKCATNIRPSILDTSLRLMSHPAFCNSLARPACDRLRAYLIRATRRPTTFL